MSFTASILSNGLRRSFGQYPRAVLLPPFSLEPPALGMGTMLASFRTYPACHCPGPTIRSPGQDHRSSARVPSTAMISLPSAVVVSIIASARERKPAPLSDMVAKTFSRFRVGRLMAYRLHVAQRLPWQAIVDPSRAADLLSQYAIRASIA